MTTRRGFLGTLLALVAAPRALTALAKQRDALHVRFGHSERTDYIAMGNPTKEPVLYRHRAYTATDVLRDREAARQRMIAMWQERNPILEELPWIEVDSATYKARLNEWPASLPDR